MALEEEVRPIETIVITRQVKLLAWEPSPASLASTSLESEKQDLQTCPQTPHPRRPQLLDFTHSKFAIWRAHKHTY